jgi:UDP-glucose 4-epimerase
MHYLVTGGCGFIGAHLVRRLLADGHAVTVIDDLSNARRDALPPQAALLAADITTRGIFDALVGQVDGCFHLAAVVSVQRSTEDWLHSHRVNAGGFLALLEALAGARRAIPVVLASSAAVYGECTGPHTETSACHPISPYGADKLACEMHASIASRLHHIPTISLRFFNVYGPGQNPASPYAGVMTVFADRLRQSLPVTIMGDGTHARDFIHVSDITNGLLAAMRRLENKELDHAILNLCTGRKTSLNELLALIAATLNVKPTIAHVPARRSDVYLSLGDPALSTRLLGLDAPVAIEDGIRMLLSSKAAATHHG